jgi:putative FmdB family regulatory protein
MPLYDFACPSCGEHFEARVSVGELPTCPACGAGHTERVFSAFAGPFTLRPRGVAARRMEADRRARSEQRAERRASRPS